jgi:hypothetical protein
MERIVLRGGPGHGRAPVVQDGTLHIEIAHSDRVDAWVHVDEPYGIGYRKFLYHRTNEFDKWGKRIYRVRKR